MKPPTSRDHEYRQQLVILVEAIVVCGGGYLLCGIRNCASVHFCLFRFNSLETTHCMVFTSPAPSLATHTHTHTSTSPLPIHLHTYLPPHTHTHTHSHPPPIPTHPGVPIVHLITYPFPHVWHTVNDNANAIDKTFVSNFRKILAVFLHEYFHLR